MQMPPAASVLEAHRRTAHPAVPMGPRLGDCIWYSGLCMPHSLSVQCREAAGLPQRARSNWMACLAPALAAGPQRRCDWLAGWLGSRRPVVHTYSCCAVFGLLLPGETG